MGIHTLLAGILLIEGLCSANGPVPREINWSPTTYGPDGPWQAVRVTAGTSNQRTFDLFPAVSWGSTFFSVAYCDNSTLGTDCPPIEGGLYDISTAVAGEFYDNSAGITDPIPQNVDGGYYFDNIQLNYINEPTPIVNACIRVIDWGYEIYPNGDNIPFTLGQFSLGAQDYNQTFTTDDGTPAHNGSIPAPFLYKNGVIPSASFGLHIGSVAAGIPGSLWLGGFDQSRAIGTVSATPYLDTNFNLDLTDIGIYTARGVSPFSFTNKTGLLTQGNSSIVNDISVSMSFGTPYMFLPPSVCSAIVEDLPVTLDNALGLYLWNTTDPRYARVISSASYLSFKFSTDSQPGSMEINAPFKLFNLTLQPPLVAENTQYFPCSPFLGESYTLGRSFMQAAFFGVNWQPDDSAAGDWFLAQAPGPGTQSSAIVTSIANTDTAINGVDIDWASTWDGYWTALEASPTATPAAKTSPGSASTASATSTAASSATSSGLSTGAKIGLGVGLGVGILALAALGFCIFRRRRNKTSAKPASSQHSLQAMMEKPPEEAAFAYSDAREPDLQSPYKQDTNTISPNELARYGSQEYPELAGHTSPLELDAGYTNTSHMRQHGS